MAKESVTETLRALRERAGMSRDQLGRAMGYANGKFLQRYEDSARYREDFYPLEIVAKLAFALAGKGAPPIDPTEIWGLAKLQSGLMVVPGAVVAVPVLGWEMLKLGQQALKRARPEGAVNVAGLPAGNHFALEVIDHRCALIAPPGSKIIIDANQTILSEGGHYLLLLNAEPEIRLYHSNPARFESLALPPAAAVYPTGPVEVIGRAVLIITSL